jgi:hypothetical protein
VFTFTVTGAQAGTTTLIVSSRIGGTAQLAVTVTP